MPERTGPKASTVVGGCVAVLLIDAIGSLISRATGFPYGYFAFVSLALYIAIGIINGYTRSIRAAAVCAFVVSFVDATIGWWISWQLGAARLPAGGTTAMFVIALTATLVIGFETLVGFGAGAITHAIRSRAALR